MKGIKVYVKRIKGAANRRVQVSEAGESGDLRLAGSRDRHPPRMDTETRDCRDTSLVWLWPWCEEDRVYSSPLLCLAPHLQSSVCDCS
ncbi:hypothetical protein E2C01_039995 [Portunus trituberculatus]|uniref:Uncharacterized protein n=1 Tax=Portunus trituberculatus TaxID=210409 RepID=A0A5B7FF93_PORTR|nr:hypothetical protein [Portunus trituberculatus]